MAVDSEGVFYLTGFTDDSTFPLRPTHISTPTAACARDFVSVIDTKLPGADGLTYSTFFGGTTTDIPTGIAVAGGKIYVTGYTSSKDYPVTANAYQGTLPGGTFDGWVAEFDPSQSGTASLVASTYLGGSGLDVPRSIAVAADGQVWVAGYTRSSDFPSTPNSFRPSYSGGGDAFLTRLDLNAMALTYSTFLGGSGRIRPPRCLWSHPATWPSPDITLSNDFPVTPGRAAEHASRKRRRISDHPRSQCAGFHQGPGLFHLLRRE